MTEQDAIFVDEDVPGPPGALTGARSSELENMMEGAPPREFMPNNKAPYYVAATAALAITGSLAYNRFKKEDTIEEEPIKKTTQRLRGDADYRMDGIHAQDSQVKMVNFGAKLIQEVYKVRNTAQGGLNLLSPLKDIVTGEVRKYYTIPDDEFLGLKRYDTGNDLAMGFYDEDTFYFAIRGLDVKNDFRDFVQGGAMALKSLSSGDPDDMGSVFSADVSMLEKSLLQAVRLYPNKKFVLLGHSRGAAASLVLGRKLNLQTHAYNPASTRGEYHRDYSGYDTHNINIYTTNRDIVPRNLRNTAGYSPETHVNIITQNQDIMFEHGIGHFVDSQGWMSLRVRDNPLNEFYDEDDDVIIMDPFIERIEYAPQAFSNIPFIPNNRIRENIDNVVNPSSGDDALDLDGDGVITYVEFVRYWSKRGRDMDTIKQMFKSLDINGNNVLDANEY
tara:strand:- start:1147 stop:2484 length:1338 start_codon:yes stop_codon:yes gene_type:complete